MDLVKDHPTQYKPSPIDPSHCPEGYNDSEGLLDFAQLARLIVKGGWVHHLSVTPVKRHWILLVYATGNPPIVTITVDPILYTIVTLKGVFALIGLSRDGRLE